MPARVQETSVNVPARARLHVEDSSYLSEGDPAAGDVVWI